MILVTKDIEVDDGRQGFGPKATWVSIRH